ncbi:hypothetical protein PAAG_12334 [Paracoccidioides lutzii Pb01]|uniref:Uncharacterized protein n=1 Tax=Paracoccidioides lutzii (strain ATCC MYA-826 / Pb01) TaxID=502779 RepID=A0A0A2V3K3_PARBA|nr:hypothetical protein PAAG_12334 [Paracoccidioides lutzii Pb01]KGQ00962.1 hypothetical protein PAAG_12334 [Paracoccidioides lutzii Pb01]
MTGWMEAALGRLGIQLWTQEGSFNAHSSRGGLGFIETETLDEFKRTWNFLSEKLSTLDYEKELAPNLRPF